MESRIRSAYLSGHSSEASSLRNELFRSAYPVMFRQINDELEELLVTNPLSDLIEDLAEIGENVGFDLSFEWRIKSVASISDSMSAADSCEKSISSVRDLVGLRFWIGCESLRDYPPKMLSLLRSITSQSRHRHLISHLRMIRMDDHPHQKVTVYFRINNVNAEVKSRMVLFDPPSVERSTRCGRAT